MTKLNEKFKNERLDQAVGVPNVSIFNRDHTNHVNGALLAFAKVYTCIHSFNHIGQKKTSPIATIIVKF